MEILFMTDMHGNTHVYRLIESFLQQSDGIVLIGGDMDSLTMTEKLVSMAIHSGRIVMVAGNHDYPIYLKERGILHGTTITMGGYKIGGLSGSLPVGGWPFENSESEYEILCRNMGPVDILLSHQPAYRTNSDILTGTVENGYHIGSKAIKNYVVNTQPLIVCSGHIHESPGIGKVGNTVTINPGDYLHGNYAKINIDGENIRVTMEKDLVEEGII